MAPTAITANKCAILMSCHQTYIGNILIGSPDKLLCSKDFSSSCSQLSIMAMSQSDPMLDQARLSLAVPLVQYANWLGDNVIPGHEELYTKMCGRLRGDQGFLIGRIGRESNLEHDGDILCGVIVVIAARRLLTSPSVGYVSDSAEECDLHGLFKDCFDKILSIRDYRASFNPDRINTDPAVHKLITEQYKYVVKIDPLVGDFVNTEFGAELMKLMVRFEIDNQMWRIPDGWRCDLQECGEAVAARVQVRVREIARELLGIQRNLHKATIPQLRWMADDAEKRLL